MTRIQNGQADAFQSAHERKAKLRCVLRLLPAEPEERARLLRVLRSLRGYSQREVEQALSISATYLSALETGKRNPGRQITERLIAFYDVNQLEAALLNMLLQKRRTM